jgi:hypothetical protein
MAWVVANLATHFELTSWVGPQVERPLLSENAGGYQHRAVRCDRVAQPDDPHDAGSAPPYVKRANVAHRIFLT